MVGAGIEREGVLGLVAREWAEHLLVCRRRRRRAGIAEGVVALPSRTIVRVVHERLPGQHAVELERPCRRRGVRVWSRAGERAEPARATAAPSRTRRLGKLELELLRMVRAWFLAYRPLRLAPGSAVGSGHGQSELRRRERKRAFRQQRLAGCESEARVAERVLVEVVRHTKTAVPARRQAGIGVEVEGEHRLVTGKGAVGALRSEIPRCRGSCQTDCCPCPVYDRLDC